jgi:hypothetical protein
MGLQCGRDDTQELNSCWVNEAIAERHCRANPTEIDNRLAWSAKGQSRLITEIVRIGQHVSKVRIGTPSRRTHNPEFAEPNGGDSVILGLFVLCLVRIKPPMVCQHYCPKSDGPSLSNWGRCAGAFAMYLTVRTGSLGTQSSKLKNQIRDSCPEAHCPAVQKVMLTYPQKITFGEMRDSARADVRSNPVHHEASNSAPEGAIAL